MADKARRRAPPRAMAEFLRRGPVDAAANAEPLLQGPSGPSAEYVAQANELMGREGVGPAVMEAMLADERELGGEFGRMALASEASGRLPVSSEVAPQGSPASAEAVALAKQAGLLSPDAARAQQQAFQGAQASGSSGANMRMLAALLRGGR